jgi:hypothetical protein
MYNIREILPILTLGSHTEWVDRNVVVTTRWEHQCNAFSRVRSPMAGRIRNEARLGWPLKGDREYEQETKSCAIFSCFAVSSHPDRPHLRQL